MIGLCRNNKGEAMMPAPAGFPYSTGTVFPVTPGKQYEIYGMGLYNDVLLALIQADHDLPTWVPAQAFEFFSQQIPGHWKFALWRKDSEVRGRPIAGWTAVWGHARLVDGGEPFIEGLIERTPESMAAFYRELVARPRESA